MRNQDILEGKWKQAKGKLREQWGKLTEDEVEQIDGKTDNLIGKIQEKYGVAKEDAQKQVNKFLDKVDEAID